MSFFTLFIIISVIAAIAKAVKRSDSSVNRGRFGSSLTQRFIGSQSEERGGEPEQNAFYEEEILTSPTQTSETTGGLLRREDLQTDFGDQNKPKPATRERSKRTEILFEVQTPIAQQQPPLNRLNLTPTRKKLAESFILSECFSEPRARKPYQPRIYNKR
ncbi:hypothetical protein PU629_07670 [Pullulanibacillus sp. KACC 23026]|uniref:hypothetical protein n=1 Tax=Pullulanibacillus sp. KACC 23026 TaxID=3028315 RepID=UPI0023B17233|nr:hypothetical protein [Pullulanibacillus sp. KACC 23026]WEG14232.1 hypothetical protein PU629_07670 [Pullulanibacillus sp. KACC 23026]